MEGLKKDFKTSKCKSRQVTTHFELGCIGLSPRCASAFPPAIRRIWPRTLHTMAKYNNICNYIHLPAKWQYAHSEGKWTASTRGRNTCNSLIRSGKSARLRHLQDLIAGFPPKQKPTTKIPLSLMIKYDLGSCSCNERPGTLALRKLEDDIPSRKPRKGLASGNHQPATKHSAYRTRKTVKRFIEKRKAKSEGAKFPQTQRWFFLKKLINQGFCNGLNKRFTSTTLNWRGCGVFKNLIKLMENIQSVKQRFEIIGNDPKPTAPSKRPSRWPLPIFRCQWRWKWRGKSIPRSSIPYPTESTTNTLP